MKWPQFLRILSRAAAQPFGSNDPTGRSEAQSQWYELFAWEATHLTIFTAVCAAVVAFAAVSLLLSCYFALIPNGCYRWWHTRFARRKNPWVRMVQHYRQRYK